MSRGIKEDKMLTCDFSPFVMRSQVRRVARRYIGRTSKFENFASIESLACGCCGRPLLNHRGLSADFRLGSPRRELWLP